MDLQKAIEQISNAGESVAVNVGTSGNVGAVPVASEQPASVGIGSMGDSVSESINQAISNVGMSPEGTAGNTANEAPAPVSSVENTVAEAPVVENAETTTPEVQVENKDAKIMLAEALLPKLKEIDGLRDDEKNEIYRVLWDNGNRSTEVISEMIRGAAENPDELVKMWKAL